jgi:hypothetical protein
VEEKETGKFDIGTDQKELPVKNSMEAAGEDPVEDKTKAPAENAEKAGGAKKAVAKAGKEAGKKQNPKAFLEKNLIPITAIVCVAIAIIGVGTLFGPGEAGVEDFWNDNAAGPSPVDAGQLRMIVVNSDRCPSCHIGSSMQVLFEENDLNYAIVEYEEKTEDGQGLIKSLGIEKLPAFIIEEASLTNGMLVGTNQGKKPIKQLFDSFIAEGQGTYGEGIYTFPEMFLDDLQHSNLLLGDACGNKDNIMVHFFLDPYDPHTIKRSRDIETAMSFLKAEPDLNSSFRYSYLPTYSAGLAQAYLDAFGGNPETVKDNIEGAARYLVCANDKSIESFVNMQRAIYSTYCEIDWETLEAADVKPLWECGDSNHFGFFLNGEELIEATERAGVENDIDFGLCLYTVESRFPAMKALAETVGVNRTPTALVNCQYEVPITNLFASLCLIDEGYGFCNQYR